MPEARLHDHSTIAVEVHGDGPTVLLAVADAAGADRFAYCGYSTSPASEDASGEPDWSQVQVTLTEAQTRQFVTLYHALQVFDDRAAQARLGCPRLCFAGSADEIDYGERWGGVQVSMAGPVVSRKAELEALGRCDRGRHQFSTFSLRSSITLPVR